MADAVHVRLNSTVHIKLVNREGSNPRDFVGKTAVEHAAAQWLATIRQGIADSTYEYYRHNITTYWLYLVRRGGKDHLRYTSLQDALDPHHINEFVDFRGGPADMDTTEKELPFYWDLTKKPMTSKPRTSVEARYHPFRARAALITVRAFANWIIENCPLVTVRLVGLRPVKTNIEARSAFTDEEARRLLDAAKRTQMSGRDYPMLYTALSTGLRLNELSGLRVLDLDFHRHLIKVRGDTAKNGKPRDVMIDSTLEEVLRKYIADHRLNAPANAHLWITQEGKEFSREGLRGVMRTLGKRSNVPHAQWHRCRHYYASALRRAGVELFTVRDQLGHSGLTTLLRYARVQPDQRPPMPAVVAMMSGPIPSSGASQAAKTLLDSLVPLGKVEKQTRIRMRLN